MFWTFIGSQVNSRPPGGTCIYNPLPKKLEKWLASYEVRGSRYLTPTILFFPIVKSVKEMRFSWVHNHWYSLVGGDRFPRYNLFSTGIKLHFLHKTRMLRCILFTFSTNSFHSLISQVQAFTTRTYHATFTKSFLFLPSS